MQNHSMNKVIHRDCFEVFPELASEFYHLVLTDPPYCISKKTNFHKMKKINRKFHISMNFGAWDQEEIDLDLFAQHIYRLLKKSGTAIVFYDLWKLGKLKDSLEKAGFKMFRLIEWIKTNPLPVNTKATYLSTVREMAVVCVKGSKPIFKSDYDNGIYYQPIPKQERMHPTQKPDKLIQLLIQKHSNQNDWILDPFAGSGTTLLASKSTGRNSYGMEKDEKWFRLAQERLNSFL